MGFFEDKIRKMVAASVTPAQQPMIQNIVQPGGSQNIQGIDPYWFSALRPVTPTTPDSYRARQWPFIPGFNIIWEPRGEDTARIPFNLLYQVDQEWDLWRAAKKTVVDRIATLDWQIRAVTGPDEPESKIPSADEDPTLDQLTAVFEHPDGVHSFEQWIRMLLNDLYVGDCATVFVELDESGKGCMPKTPIKSFMPVDGSTIKVLIDDMGRRPQGIDPKTGEKDSAFQQVVYGLPAQNFTEDDIIYAVQNPKNKSAYGVSYLEDILVWANIGIRAQEFTLAYYTKGNTPEMIIGVDPTVPAQKVEEWNEMLDSYLSGQLGERRKIKMLPALGSDGKLNAIFPKEPLLKSDLDEWLARIVCFVLGLNPQAFVKSMNRATSEQAQDTAEAEGQGPVVKWVESLVNECIRRLGYSDDYEFTFRVRREQDGLKQSQIDTAYLKVGVFSINQVLEDLGMDTIDEDWADEHYVETPNGPIPFSQAGTQPGTPGAPQPPAAAASAAPPAGGSNPKKPGAKPATAQKAKHRSPTVHVEDVLHAKLARTFREARAEALAYLKEAIAQRKKAG